MDTLKIHLKEVRIEDIMGEGEEDYEDDVTYDDENCSIIGILAGRTKNVQVFDLRC